MTITIEEAIKILDPETSRDALWEYETGEERLEACNEACRVACTVLRAQQTPVKLDRRRWKECWYCKDAKRDNLPYCSDCWKPLTEEAWAELEQRIGGNDETD